MKRFFLILFASVAAFSAVHAQTPKYVFYFIGDGMGMNHAYAAQAFNKATGAGDLNFFTFPVKAVVTTYSASSLVTDSSAAGTALASGTKINSNALGVDPQGANTVPFTEIAKRNGWGTGVITSVGVNHATPASFYGHAADRNSFDTLSRQLIDADFVDFCAGSTFLTQRGSDKDNDYWVGEARRAGIKVYLGEYEPTKDRRVIMLNSDPTKSSLEYAIDRKDGDTRLADFTSAAIDYLSNNFRKGFFLMVEGGKIDYAAHAQDAATTVRETIDMAESVQLALDFAAKHPNETLIIVTADHETGGFSMGSGRYEMHPEMLANQKCSKDVLTAKITKLRKDNEVVEWRQVKELLGEELGLWNEVPVSKRAEKALTEVYKDFFLDYEEGNVRNLYSSNDRMTVAAIEHLEKSAAMMTFPFGSHSGAPVMLYAFGARATEFATCMDNTDIPNTLVKVTKLK